MNSNDYGNDISTKHTLPISWYPSWPNFCFIKHSILFLHTHMTWHLRKCLSIYYVIVFATSISFHCIPPQKKNIRISIDPIDSIKWINEKKIRLNSTKFNGKKNKSNFQCQKKHIHKLNYYYKQKIQIRVRTIIEWKQTIFFFFSSLLSLMMMMPFNSIIRNIFITFI